MIPYPNETDNVTWAREGELARLRHGGGGISLYLSSLTPATELYARHIDEEFGARWRKGGVGHGIWGDEQLMQCVADREGVAAEDVMITSGCTQSFDMLCRTYLLPGDEIILERPGYEVHAAIARDCGAVVRYISRGHGDDAIDLDEVEEALGPRTKIVGVTNLHNPSGSFLTEPFIEKFGALVASHGAILAIDEVYRDYLPDDKRARAIGSPSEGIVRFDSLTKTYGIDGICCGWMIAPEVVRKRLREQYSRGLISVAALSLRAAVMVFDHLPEYQAHQHAVMKRNHALFASFFGEAEREGLAGGAVPQAGPIAFIEALGETDDRIWAWFARTKDLMLIPGAIYGRAGSTRIGIGGNTADLQEGLGRLLDGLRMWPDHRHRQRREVI
jgi:aspartate/methionine/tyrosine aminotransferase